MHLKIYTYLIPITFLIFMVKKALMEEEAIENIKWEMEVGIAHEVSKKIQRTEIHHSSRLGPCSRT